MTAQLIVGAVLAIAGLVTLDRLRLHEDFGWLIMVGISGVFITFGLHLILDAL
jgi:hypothetical protein